MIQGKKIVSILLIMVLCLGLTLQVQASGISETEEKVEELEKQKSEAEAQKNSLASQLESLLADVEETKAAIDKKELELSEKEEELYQAQAKENDQYESMKKRIKYMYENGNTEFIEILCNSKDIGEFLNNAEYITTISEYDREQLVEFQEVVKQVQKQEQEIKEEYEELNAMQDSLIAKQQQVEAMLSEKESEISNLESELGSANAKLKKLKEAAAEAERKKQEAAAAAAASSSSSSSAGAAVVSGNGMFTHPCPGYTRISSYFGYRKAPLAGASTNHKGMDLAAPTGTPIYAAAGGTVISAGYSGNAGNLIIINHGNGLQTYYMHCHKIYVSAGQKVSKGQNIGQVGTTGNSTGPHLHFQVMKNGVPTDPLNYL